MYQNVCLFPCEISTIIAFSSKLGCSCRAYVFVYSLERKDRVAPLLTFKLTIVQLLQLKDYERIRASDKKIRDFLFWTQNNEITEFYYHENYSLKGRK